MRHAALLSGEHPTLPAAELRALLDVHAPAASVAWQGLLAVVGPGQGGPGSDGGLLDDGIRTALGRMALCAEWGRLWALASGEGAAEALEQAVEEHADGMGTAAIRFLRRGERKNPRAVEMTRRLGGALARAGHRIDLGAPERIFFLWLLDDVAAFGERLGGSSGHEERHLDGRDHFKPVSLHPRRAASLLHLARVPLRHVGAGSTATASTRQTPAVGSSGSGGPGPVGRPGRILDPFCGTGGIVLEAALEGYDAWGSDLDPWMVQGTLQTLADAGPEPLDGTVFEADIARVPDLVDGIDGIVTDLPYGRASSSDGEALAQLYDRALAAFARILPPGGHAVVGHAQPDLLAGAARYGLQPVETHAEFVHKSLTRHYTVLRRG